MKIYGNLVNRLDENKIYKENKLIEVGDDVTEYYGSDRTCGYVIKVENQKHIGIKRYEVIADKIKEGGMGHQNGVYIKDERQPVVELVYRYNKGYEKYTNKGTNKTTYRKYQPISFGVRDYYYDGEF